MHGGEGVKIIWTSANKSLGMTREGFQVIRCRKRGITSNPVVWKVYDKRGVHIGDFGSERAALGAMVEAAGR